MPGFSAGNSRKSNHRFCYSYFSWCEWLVSLQIKLRSCTMHQISLTLTRQEQRKRKQKNSRRGPLGKRTILLRLLGQKLLFDQTHYRYISHCDAFRSLTRVVTSSAWLSCHMYFSSLQMPLRLMYAITVHCRSQNFACTSKEIPFLGQYIDPAIAVWAPTSDWNDLAGSYLYKVL